MTPERSEGTTEGSKLGEMHSIVGEPSVLIGQHAIHIFNIKAIQMSYCIRVTSV